MDPIVHIRQVRMPRVMDAAPKGVPRARYAKYERGRWYYVEVHLANFGVHGPAALGVVHVATERCVARVEFHSLYVLDDVRHAGFGRLVVCAVRERWPTATWSDTRSSRPFHETLVHDGIARVAYKGGPSWHYEFTKSSPTVPA